MTSDRVKTSIVSEHFGHRKNNYVAEMSRALAKRTVADVSPPENATLHARGVHLCSSRLALEASYAHTAAALCSDVITILQQPVGNTFEILGRS